MQFSEFISTYHRLHTKLIDFRAHSIAQTPQYLQAQQRGVIGSTNFKLRQILNDEPILRRSIEFNNLIPTELIVQDARTGENSEQYKMLEVTVAEAQAELARLGKLLPKLPSPSDYAQARHEVDSYLHQYFKHGSSAIAKLDLSSTERFQLSRLWWKGKKFSLDEREWGYFADGYDSLDEPTIESFLLGGESVAHVTKNSYGVLCLNSLRVMFVDIDTDFNAEDIAASALPWGRTQAVESEILANIHDVAKDCGLVLEIYKTANGFRLLEMSRTWDANSYESQALLERLGSDRLYQKLCLAQSCYRARLQLKPWRSGDTVCIRVGTASEASDLSAFKLCSPLHEECLFIKAIHDRYCCTGEDLA